MSDTDPRRAYIITFRKLLRHWRACNLSDEISTTVALKGARERHPLTEDQYRDVDEFLKLQPGESRKPKTKPSVPINADFDVM
jgi:hypothetical protein